MIISISPMAGKAKRLRPLSIPKDIFPLIKGEEVIPSCMFNLMEIRKLGCKKFIFVIKPDKQKDLQYLSNSFESDESLYLCQELSNGMPYALLQTEPFLPSQSTIIFSMPDTFIHPADAFEKCFKAFSPEYDLIIAYFPVGACLTLPKYGVQKTDSGDMIWGFVMFRLSFVQFIRQCFLTEQTRILAESENGEPKFKTFLTLAREHLKVTEIRFDGYKYFDLGSGQFIKTAQEFLIKP